MNTNAAKIIDALGGTAEVARLFGVRMPSISRWRVAGIPGARMMYLQAVRPDVLQGVDVPAATAPPTCLPNRPPAPTHETRASIHTAQQTVA